MNKPKTLFVSFDRSWAGYAGLAFGVSLLNLFTAGLYKPYGLTRIHKALYKNIYINGDALDYTGDAKSLSQVSFYPSLAFLFLLIVPSVLQFMVSLKAAVAIGVAQLVLVIAFYHYRGFLERQYELSQISWRGQSFTMTGSAYKSMWHSLGFQFAGLFTLGLTSLWRRLWLARRDYGGLYYGRTRAECTVSAKPLLMYFIPGWVFSTIGLYCIWLWVREDAIYVWTEMLSPMVSGASQMAQAAAGQPQADFYGGGLGIPGMDGMSDPDAMAASMTKKINALFSVGLAWPVWMTWRQFCLALYEAKWLQHLAHNVKIGHLNADIDTGVASLFLLTTVSYNVNFIMVNLTRPFTTFARIRYLTKRLVVRDSSA